MRIARALPMALLLSGCWPPAHAPAPEEDALIEYKLGEERIAQGRYSEAAPHYEFVVAARWRWKDPYVKLAACRQAEGREEDAVAVLEKLLSVDRFDETGLRDLARIRARRGETEKAIELYRRLHDVAPGDAAVGGELARLEAMKKNGRP